YRLKAVFEGVWQPTKGEELNADGRPLLTPDELEARNERLAPIYTRIAELEESLGALHRSERQRLLQERGFPVSADAPRPVAQWTFDTDARDDFGKLHASLTETAELTTGRLRPVASKEVVTLATPPLPFDVREKTLEAWIHVRKLPEKTATILRIRNSSGFRGAAFDGIQYVDGTNKKWEHFATVRCRSDARG